MQNRRKCVRSFTDGNKNQRIFRKTIRKQVDQEKFQNKNVIEELENESTQTRYQIK